MLEMSDVGGGDGCFDTWEQPASLIKLVMEKESPRKTGTIRDKIRI